MRIELACPTQALLTEIADKSIPRRHVAMTYALAMKSSVETDFAVVNRAIVARWSMSALKWIKLQALSGKCFERKEAT